MGRIVGLWVLLAVSSCGPTPEQIDQMHQEQAAEHRRQMDANATTCQQDYKAKPGSNAFTQCMVAIGQQQAAQKASQQQSAAIALAYLGTVKTPAPYQVPIPTYTPYRAPVSVNCTSSPVGTVVYTNCH